MLYLNGRGNLAARCCSKYSGKHSWNDCGKDSWSNHASGKACDTSILHSGRGGSYTNVCRDKEARRIWINLGGGAPVRNEPWHLELGTGMANN